ncbi:MAG: hypothetical protein WAU81_14945 [Candidatus Aminicenantales bacterium]
MEPNDQSQSYNRRRFLEHFAALGLASVFPAAGMAQTAQGGQTEITPETIAEAAKLIGMEFSPEERRKIAETIGENLEAYQALRASGMDETVFPSMVFNPVPAGALLPVERLPFVCSQPDVRKPASIEEAAYLPVVELAALIETRPWWRNWRKWGRYCWRSSPWAGWRRAMNGSAGRPRTRGTRRRRRAEARRDRRPGQQHHRRSFQLGLQARFPAAAHRLQRLQRGRAGRGGGWPRMTRRMFVGF